MCRAAGAEGWATCDAALMPCVRRRWTTRSACTRSRWRRWRRGCGRRWWPRTRPSPASARSWGRSQSNCGKPRTSAPRPTTGTGLMHAGALQRPTLSQRYTPPPCRRSPRPSLSSGRTGKPAGQPWRVGATDPGRGPRQPPWSKGSLPAHPATGRQGRQNVTRSWQVLGAGICPTKPGLRLPGSTVRHSTPPRRPPRPPDPTGRQRGRNVRRGSPRRAVGVALPLWANERVRGGDGLTAEKQVHPTLARGCHRHT